MLIQLLLDSAYRAAVAGWAGGDRRGAGAGGEGRRGVRGADRPRQTRPEDHRCGGGDWGRLDRPGTQGKSRMEHALLGSVSEVLRHANRTVLVVGGHPEGETLRKRPTERRAMKRHPSLSPFSDDHHQGLVNARRLRRSASGEGGSSADSARDFLEFWQRDTSRHFRKEEEVLLPVLA